VAVRLLKTSAKKYPFNEGGPLTPRPKAVKISGSEQRRTASSKLDV
jgi:hypothetical protein